MTPRADRTGSEHLSIDHVIMGVSDLDAASRVLTSRHGITVLPGGVHPAWGTANRIVPLGSSYLELATVVDGTIAAESAFGSWVQAMIVGATGWGWVARTHDMAATAARLDLDVASGSRVRDDGVTLTWNLAGVPASAQEWSMPFFVEWGPDTPHPGATAVIHDCGDLTLSSLVVDADAGDLTRWLDAAELPLVVHPGHGGITDVVLRTGAGLVTLSPGL